MTYEQAKTLKRGDIIFRISRGKTIRAEFLEYSVDTKSCSTMPSLLIIEDCLAMKYRTMVGIWHTTELGALLDYEQQLEDSLTYKQDELDKVQDELDEMKKEHKEITRKIQELS